ncbi:protein of unknown function (coil coil domain) [endosymbiont DhMRE of Dentiscutata heterogama]|uniref:hypothetical protein n=1 Tax=endosymbiont DhMRE of Dentiscutata heterogama TaxID=1609546 RepID=UPI000629D4D3|nr:hypothetical protein [endosymbiont DhMRE of Dentiscutata heterogama]CFW92785.1 protein of unknown function (coil coil domain) [endosymbiont DhMRE of Dentiscutata heterogama]
MVSLKEEIKSIGEQIKKENEWGKIRQLLSEMKQKLENITSEEMDDAELEVISIGNFIFIITKLKTFYNQWEEKKLISTDKQLDEAEKLIKVVIGDVGKFTEEEFPPNYDIEGAKSSLASLEIEIQAAKTRRQSVPGNGGGNNDNGGGNSNNNDKNDPAIQAKINSLQGQINALEEKLRNQPTSNTNQQDKRELARLRRELEELKEKQKDKSQNKGHNQKDNFPTGLVVGGGIIIFLLLVLVIFFWRKSRRK